MKIYRHTAMLAIIFAIVFPIVVAKPMLKAQESIEYTSVSVTVDHSQTFEEMVEAGHYDWVDKNLSSDLFSIKEGGKSLIEITIVHFNRVILSDEAIRKMDALGYRPATIEEILAIGCEQPDLQRSFPIIALGSVGEVRGDHIVPFLGQGGSRRYLSLSTFSRGWNDYYRFAFIRRSSKL